MKAFTPQESKRNIRNLSLEEIRQTLIEWKEQQSYRAKQVWEWIWQKHAQSFEEMTNINKPLRKLLETNFYFTPLIEKTRQQASDGTIKIGFQTFDGYIIESVLIPTSNRKTACISSQVGCSLDCSFCATGKLKRKRNLQADEIVDQVYHLEKIAQEIWKTPLSNIVFMGMGEPLLNYNEVIKSIQLITDPQLRGMSPRRITVSTAGIAKAIKRLADDQVRFELALSLHVCDDKKRSQLMSINKHNTIKELEESLSYFYAKTKSKLTLEYLLLAGINDSENDAKELVALYRRVPIKLVNIIEYNRTEKKDRFLGSSEKKKKQFIEVLEKQRVNVRIRRSRGNDIDAACGQLASKEAGAPPKSKKKTLA